MTQAPTKSSLEAPDASNAVLFHMMNFYKRRAESLEEENQHLKKRMKQQYEDHRNEMGDLQQQLHDQFEINHRFSHVNLRTTEACYRKHQAGLRLAHCFEDLAAAIELVDDTHTESDKPMSLRYITMKKTEIMGRADIAIQMLVARDPEDEVTRFENELADNLLQIEQHIIDLTADDSGEETETEPEWNDGEETEDEL